MQQETFFSTDVHPAKNWGWILLFRQLDVNNDGVTVATWTQWCPFDRIFPWHFRSEFGAQKRLAELLADRGWARKVELGLIEFRIEPKYLGCIPEASEKWIG